MNLTVSLGDILQIAVFCLGGYGLFVSMRDKLNSVVEKQDKMELELQGMQTRWDLLTRTDERLKGLDARVSAVEARMNGPRAA